MRPLLDLADKLFYFSFWDCYC